MPKKNKRSDTESYKDNFSKKTSQSSTLTDDEPLEGLHQMFYGTTIPQEKANKKEETFQNSASTMTEEMMPPKAHQISTPQEVQDSERGHRAGEYDRKNPALCRKRQETADPGNYRSHHKNGATAKKEKTEKKHPIVSQPVSSSHPQQNLMRTIHQHDYFEKTGVMKQDSQGGSDSTEMMQKEWSEGGVACKAYAVDMNETKVMDDGTRKNLRQKHTFKSRYGVPTGATAVCHQWEKEGEIIYTDELWDESLKAYVPTTDASINLVKGPMLGEKFCDHAAEAMSLKWWK